ncbi:M42 family metallopeptidase [Methanohalophilus sp.]|uniref:M42 family metallopeptidase n=1 Tax=Methanohalophilus sp. TaxID=1966352 RepID=UPI0026298807|nr:M42 family metallopeptidase [Methanohalophilus sp.]MDK2892215.1 hypothetical protein [Methanohalophilus sp.]
MDVKEILQKLANAHGISGHEQNVRQIMEKEIKPYVDEIRTDKMGNLIATKHGKGPSIMLAAHMDEIGLMVKYIDDKGFLRFVKIGGWFDQTLHSQRVIVHAENGPLHGVIGSKPPHVMKEEDRKNPVKAEDMFIDIGAKNKEEAEKLGVKIGTPISLDRDFVPLLNGLYTCKAFDNRAGVALLIETMRQISEMKVDATIYAVGTVQEEVGLKGARTSAFGIDPDVAIATDVTIPGDHPGIEKKDSALEIGKGPVITVVDAGGRGLMADQNVVRWLSETAEENEIPYQLDVGDGGTTDATAIHLTKEGIPSSTISVPVRYIHSPVEVISIEDLKACATLIAKAAVNVSKYF